MYIMNSLAIFFSYALQFYVVMDIIGPNIIKPRVSDRNSIFSSFAFCCFYSFKSNMQPI